MELLRAIKNYQPFNEQEALDKELILQQLTSNDQVFLRQSKLAHITVSAWIISPDYQKVLMAYHNIYQSWAWLGGHADGETAPLGFTTTRMIAHQTKANSGTKSSINFLGTTANSFVLNNTPLTDGRMPKA